uniref:V-set and transmembrane domain containing 1 n=1 Tax=Otolemur garnettii TaxID=30611 RepID=H0WUU7_OTOGA
MVTEVLPLLCLGLSLAYKDEKNEKLPKPALSAWPSSVVGCASNVTLRCQAPFHNVTTFVLQKPQDSEYQQEQSSAGEEAGFPLTDLGPGDAGTYVCAYRTGASRGWSDNSEPLWLVVTDKRDELGGLSKKTADTRIVSVTIVSCISLILLFLSVVFIYRCTQPGSSHEESAERTSCSKFPEQEATAWHVEFSKMERTSLSAEDLAQGVTFAELNANAPTEAVSVPTEESLKV